jgi:ankyrin repeat protein
MSLMAGRQTPLHRACRDGSSALISTPIECGADANVGDCDGKAPLLCVLCNGETTPSSLPSTKEPSVGNRT